MLEKLQDALRAMGADVSETSFTAGEYYDGQRHGETFPCLAIYNDRALNGYVGCAMRRTIERCLRRHPLYAVEEFGGLHYDRFRVALKRDLDRAARLNLESETFLEAFWRELHKNPAARDNDAALAIAAGRRAVAKLPADAA